MVTRNELWRVRQLETHIVKLHCAARCLRGVYLVLLIFEWHDKAPFLDCPHLIPAVPAPVVNMGVLSILWMLLAHPDEARSMVQYRMYHMPKRDITNPSEYATSGYDRKAMKRCWEFLDMTSRSFSVVIKEIDGDLARVVRIRAEFHAFLFNQITDLCRFICRLRSST